MANAKHCPVPPMGALPHSHHPTSATSPTSRVAMANATSVEERQTKRPGLALLGSLWGINTHTYIYIMYGICGYIWFIMADYPINIVP